MINNTCLFCKKDKGNRPMYCSKTCVKKAWYLRNNPHCFYGDAKDWYKTETGIGFKWEKYIADLIGGEHLIFNLKNKETQSADIKLGDKLIDVKSAHLNKRKNKRGKPVKSTQKGFWVFKGGKPKEIDYIFCVCVGDNEEVIKVLKIPYSEYNYSKGITVGWVSNKYDKYLFCKKVSYDTY